MQVESNQLVLKTDCGIFVDRQRNCCAAASAAGGERRKDKGVAILDYALGNRPSTGGKWAAGCVPNAPGASWFLSSKGCGRGRRKRGWLGPAATSPDGRFNS